MRRDHLGGQAIGDSRGLGEVVAVREVVSHAQECELAVHRHHEEPRHVFAIRNDDVEPVVPAGYGKPSGPAGASCPGAGHRRMERSSVPSSRMA